MKRRTILTLALTGSAFGYLAGCAQQPPAPPAPPVPPPVTPAPAVRIPIAQIDRGVQFVLPDAVLFEFGKATFNEKESGPYLDRLAQLLMQKSNKPISVEGHTDNIGSDQFNQRLSEQRAAAVAKALEARGVSASRISQVGYSFKRPVAPNDLDAGRRLNRRTEIIVIDEKLETFTRDEPAGAFEDAVARIKAILEAGKESR